MSAPVFDRFLAELAAHGITLADPGRVQAWITGHLHRGPYDEPSNPKETPVSVETLRAELDSYIAKAETDAAKVLRFESQPLVLDAITALETIPGADAVIAPVLAGLKALSSLAPAAPTAHEAAGEQPPADLQNQTGIAQ